MPVCGGAGRCIGDKVAVFRIIANGAPDHHTDVFFRYPVVGQDHVAPGKLVNDRPIGALANFSAIPEIIVDVGGQIRNANRFAGAIGHGGFALCLAGPAIAAGNRQRLFEPTVRIFAYRNQIGNPGYRLNAIDKLRAGNDN